MKPFIIHPPLGYSFSQPDPLIVRTKNQLLELCMAMTDDPNIIRNMALDSHRGRLSFLRGNGFEIEYI